MFGQFTNSVRCHDYHDERFLTNQARRQRGGIGGIAPRFLFLPPPDLFLALPLYFFLKVLSIALTVKIVVILIVPSPILTSILFD